MREFWNQSWDCVDINRVNGYIKRIENTELSSDTIIDYLKSQQVKTVCDAGCGCGAYSHKLALNGFKVCGFDISSRAISIAKELALSKNLAHTDFRVCDILSTSYSDNQFDAVVSRDVIDHISLMDGVAAIRELYRIVKNGGSIILTLDKLDDEYETEPHFFSSDGDYIFTGGKWDGMVFHPYSESEISRLVQIGTIKHLESMENGFQVIITK